MICTVMVYKKKVRAYNDSLCSILRFRHILGYLQLAEKKYYKTPKNIFTKRRKTTTAGQKAAGIFFL